MSEPEFPIDEYAALCDDGEYPESEFSARWVSSAAGEQNAKKHAKSF